LARLSQKDKDLILADYHTGDYSQRELAKKHGVSIGTINKITKDVDPKNEHLVNAQIALLKGQSELPNEQMNAIMNTANDKVRRMGLVFGGLEKLAQKASIAIDRGKAQKVVSGKFGTDVVEHELQSSDYKNYADALEKVGKSLGVIENKADVEVNTQQITGVQLIDS
jgi:predicted transcriptional regulator